MEVEEPSKSENEEISTKKEKEEEGKLTEEEKKYVKVYPIYIDKNSKYSNGRRIKKDTMKTKFSTSPMTNLSRATYTFLSNVPNSTLTTYTVVWHTTNIWEAE